MNWSLSNRSVPELVAGAYIAVVIIAIIVAASTSGAAFGAFTFSWEGTSDLRGEAESADADLHIVTDTEQYDEQPADESIAFVFSPDEGYDGEDSERLQTFVENGGTLVVADAFGPHGNPLLEEVGASAQFNGDPLRDEWYYYRSPSLPIANNIGDHPYVAQSDEITLNQGTAVEPGGATVLAASSEYGYLDHNRNQELDDDETLGTYPVVTAENVGEGEVVAVSDPSIFINVMLERPGNQAFAQGLFALHDNVLFDTSHSTDVPPTAMAVISLRESAALQILLGGGLLLSIAVIHRRPSLKPLRQSSSTSDNNVRIGMSDTELRRVLDDRYPSLSEEQRDSAITTITSRKKEANDD